MATYSKLFQYIKIIYSNENVGNKMNHFKISNLETLVFLPRSLTLCLDCDEFQVLCICLCLSLKCGIIHHLSLLHDSIHIFILCIRLLTHKYIVSLSTVWIKASFSMMPHFQDVCHLSIVATWILSLVSFCVVVYVQYCVQCPGVSFLPSAEK